MIAVNLIPRQQTLHRRRRRHLSRWGVVLGVTVVISLIPLASGLSAHARAASLGSQLRTTRTRLTEVQSELVAVTTSIAETRSQLDAAAALRGKRSWTALIAMIGRVTPGDVWLTTLMTDPSMPGSGSMVDGRMTIGGGAARPGGAAAPGQRVIIEAPRGLVIQGFSARQHSIYELMSGLKATGVFVDVTLISSMQEPALRGVPVDFDLYRFELRCRW
ncbi:MAG: hypothetical protein C4547_06960 [Phycisphaerales bacterium]|nr:MAG: hypothetical protein C4547_06960 [Phycisphaerales bacterium]